MSWNNGSRVMTEIIGCLLDKVPEDDTRQEIYEELIEIFEGFNCDSLKNCFADDDVFEVAYNALHPLTNQMKDYSEDEDNLGFDLDDDGEMPDEYYDD